MVTEKLGKEKKETAEKTEQTYEVKHKQHMEDLSSQVPMFEHMWFNLVTFQIFCFGHAH